MVLHGFAKNGVKSPLEGPMEERRKPSSSPLSSFPLCRCSPPGIMTPGLATTTLATMALPMPRMSLVELRAAAFFVCLALSSCGFASHVRAQTASGVAAAASQGVDAAAAAAAGVSQGSSQTAIGHGGAASGTSQCGPSYDHTHQGNGSSVLGPPGRRTGARPSTHRCGTSPRPGVPVSRAGEFLAAHNKIRAGENEPPMRWDSVLARYARRFAAKRAVDCKMLHSYGSYGENIFWGQKDVWTPTQVVDSWASEGQYYDKANNTCANGQMCGHYTQVVWLDSTRVGCAMVTCFDGGMYTICNYDPPGNYVNESPFEPYRGDP